MNNSFNLKKIYMSTPKLISILLLITLHSIFGFSQIFRGPVIQYQNLKMNVDTNPSFKYDIHIDFQIFDSLSFYNNLDGFSKSLESIFINKKNTTYKRDLIKSYQAKNRYYLLARGVSYDQYLKIKELKIFSSKKNKIALIVEQKKIKC